MQRTFVPLAHSLENGLGVLEVNCEGRAGTADGSQGCDFFSANASDMESSGLAGVNLPSLSSFTLAR